MVLLLGFFSSLSLPSPPASVAASVVGLLRSCLIVLFPLSPVVSSHFLFGPSPPAPFSSEVLSLALSLSLSLSLDSLFGLVPLLVLFFFCFPLLRFPWGGDLFLFFTVIVSSGFSSSSAVRTDAVDVSIGTTIVCAMDLPDGDIEIFDTRSELTGAFRRLFPLSGMFSR